MEAFAVSEAAGAAVPGLPTSLASPTPTFSTPSSPYLSGIAEQVGQLSELAASLGPVSRDQSLASHATYSSSATCVCWDRMP